MQRKVYYVSRTLLGGIPDRNRRTIYEGLLKEDGKPDFRTERPVCVVNQDMHPWDATHERHLRLMLHALEVAALKEADESPTATG